MSRFPAFLTAVPLLASTLLHAAPIPARAVEAGGNLQFETVSRSDIRVNFISVQPQVHYYPTPNLFFGPKASVSFIGSDGSYNSWTSLGGEAAVITSKTGATAQLYLGGGATWEWSDYDGVGGSDGTGYTLTAFAGAKFQVGEKFFLNVQPTFNWQSLESTDLNRFGVQLGFTGLLFPGS